ncbi:BEL1-like homeodomain protein 2 [Vitis vinifera]|uniref:BEL1-like homeodomain protein 2 n=1 Tax=Vitis vinifera TaxID=29760 RepID=A0A438K1K4_VITVI|nr:BEL1-like homeodomain protein 2 [Vitis vinifera]RVX15058.1 BEL1-like homeodomain protein 2 [Vitis vinifera]
MSQSFHQSIFSFSNGYERSKYQEQHQPLQHVEEQVSGELPVYEPGGMLSEMFSFPPGPTVATEILENQISSNYRWPSQPTAANDCNNIARNQHFSRINADLANPMQLSLMNPPAKTSSPTNTSSSLHMLLPNSSNSHLQGFQHGGTMSGVSGLGSSEVPPVNFNWVPGRAAGVDGTSKIGGVMESQGLSLSLSSSLQQLEAAKAEELRLGNGGIFFCNQGVGASSNFYASKTLGTNQQPLQLQGIVDPSRQVYVGYESSLGNLNVLRNSKYAKAAQELLEEFCSVGREHYKNQRRGKHSINPNSDPGGGGGAAASGSSSSVKDLAPLSAADKIEHQRRKIKLLSMLDEARRLPS